MLFDTDGDAYGQDMLRTLEYGSKTSRHLTSVQAFPESRFENIYIAGLFPSVGEKIGLSNDLEQKRPMSNEYTKKRVDFLKKYNLIDDRDIETWERNKTYELEALSTAYKDKEGNPIGLGIYLLEYMRLKEIPLKPMPVDDDVALLAAFENSVYRHFDDSLEYDLDDNNPKEEMANFINEKLESSIEEIKEKILKSLNKKYEDELQEKIDNLDAEEIRRLCIKQYEDEPKRERYLLWNVAAKIVKQADLTIDWQTEKLKETVSKAIAEYLEALPEDFTEMYEEKVELEDAEAPEENQSLYDVAEEYLGANPKDCEKIREALEWRLNARVKEVNK